MKLLLIDAKNMNLFFQADLDDNENLSELLKDEKMEEIQDLMEEVRSENQKLLEKKEIIKSKLEILMREVNVFNEKHNEGYKGKEVKLDF